MYATHFLSGVKLNKEWSSLKVDTTLYWQLVNNLIYLTHIQYNISLILSVVS